MQVWISEGKLNQTLMPLQGVALPECQPVSPSYTGTRMKKCSTNVLNIDFNIVLGGSWTTILLFVSYAKLFFPVPHLLVVRGSVTKDISTDNSASPDAFGSGDFLESGRGWGGYTWYNNGMLYCGGAIESVTILRSCWHFCPSRYVLVAKEYVNNRFIQICFSRTTNPMSYPDLTSARSYSHMVKVHGYPWIVGNHGQDQESLIDMVNFITVSVKNDKGNKKTLVQ